MVLIRRLSVALLTAILAFAFMAAPVEAFAAAGSGGFSEVTVIGVSEEAKPAARQDLVARTIPPTGDGCTTAFACAVVAAAILLVIIAHGRSFGER